jgi:putative NIF3 family GTP cyclohydrolase 1 type 2
LAEDLGISIIYGGHYATETFGIKALMEHISMKFKIDAHFIVTDTGL